MSLPAAYVGAYFFADAGAGWIHRIDPVSAVETDFADGLHGPVSLQVEYVGYTADPWGGHRAVFTAAGSIDREDWGLTWNLPLDGGGLLVSNQIRIEIELEAVLQA